MFASAGGRGLRADRIDDADQARDTLGQALQHDGPTLVECVVDPYETPFGDVLKPAHADNIVTAYDNGEPARRRMSRSLLDPRRRNLSPAVGNVADRLTEHT
ncbi:hypothetical protein [Saccharopolyspora phatthalungensis]|uniref:Thiamine pyrophosphate enzyme TPP-binding domain-containing protein n=1 Tax=Saccharopolyspora phatthalungensis TaxID=664693 RepID=A0A840QE26_9PSEU|nr:hypothetical protein [Saccharopolyspora phatthalungensis]MBB5156918.1 hypothetical protein [Saccharopolyspora phatthalungensis]